MQVALRPSCVCLVAWLTSLLAVGCSRWHESAKLTLPPLQTPSDSVSLGIYFVNFPFNDPEMNAGLWAEVDEQEIAPEVRQRLDANGIRAGIISGQLPAALERMLKPGEPPPADGQPNAVDVRNKPAVHGSLKQLQSNKPFKLVAAGEKERLPQLTVLLRNDLGEVEGNSYGNVQGLFDAKAVVRPDGRVRLELTPQIEHGEAKMQPVQGENGAYEYAFTPPREVYEQLRFDARLLPGQMLVVGTSPNRLGSLGYHFFTEETAGKLEQKLILIRLAGNGTPDAAASAGVSTFSEDGAN